MNRNEKLNQHFQPFKKGWLYFTGFGQSFFCISIQKNKIRILSIDNLQILHFEVNRPAYYGLVGLI